MTKVLITGGAGFIGSHIAQLLHKNYEVVILDDLSTGRKENLAENIPLHIADICDTNRVEHIFQLERPSHVIHLAAHVSLMGSFKNPTRDLAINALGTVNVLQSAKNTRAERLLLASTAAVYGPQVHIPTVETDGTAPESPYGISKTAAEAYVRLYASMYGLSTCVFRMSNVYGPRQTSHSEAGAVAIFADALIHDRSITIHDDGEQSRDFIYVKDVATAVEKLLFTSYTDAVHISTGNATSINELYSLMKQITGSSSTARYSASPSPQVKRSQLSNTRITELTGWTPQHSIEDGLRETLAWYRDNVGTSYT